MRCVLMTPFGMPVEPEVNRNLAMVSGVDRGVRRIDRRRASRLGKSENVVERPPTDCAPTISTSGGTTASMRARDIARRRRRTRGRA